MKKTGTALFVLIALVVSACNTTGTEATSTTQSPASTVAEAVTTTTTQAEATTTTQAETTTTTWVPEPATFERPAESLWDIMQATPELALWNQIVEIAGWEERFADCTQDFTVFASSDIGINMEGAPYSPIVLTAIANEDAGLLGRLIKGQTVDGAYDTATIDGRYVPNLLGSEMRIGGGEPGPGDISNITNRDIPACNGFLNIIFWVAH